MQQQQMLQSLELAHTKVVGPSSNFSCAGRAIIHPPLIGGLVFPSSVTPFRLPDTTNFAPLANLLSSPDSVRHRHRSPPLVCCPTCAGAAAPDANHLCAGAADANGFCSL